MDSIKAKCTKELDMLFNKWEEGKVYSAIPCTCGYEVCMQPDIPWGKVNYTSIDSWFFTHEEFNEHFKEVE